MIFGPQFFAETGLPIPRDLKCFYCSEPINNIPYINWLGTSEITLHPSCVVDLCVRLLRDVHEVECAYSLRLQFQNAPGKTDPEERKRVTADMAELLGISSDQVLDLFRQTVEAKMKGQKL